MTRARLEGAVMDLLWDHAEGLTAAEVRTLVGEPRHAGPVTVAARGLDPADLLDAVGLADADEDDLGPEILELLEDRDDAGARRRTEEDR